MVAMELIIFGRVQGVGFRYFVHTIALRLGNIQGWVQNCHDGTVKVHCEASTFSILNIFIENCLQGPPLAKVSMIEKTTVPVLGYTSFSIRS